MERLRARDEDDHDDDADDGDQPRSFGERIQELWEKNLRKKRLIERYTVAFARVYLCNGFCRAEAVPR